VQELTIDQFANFLAADTARGPWIERLWDPRVELEGSLATVWAQYDFHFGQRFSHCGVDAFHLLKTRNGWKISSLADTYQLEGCPLRPVPSPGGRPEHGLRVERLAEGVYAVIRQEPPGLINESNSLLIIGETDVIVVDAQSSIARTRETIAALRQITPKPVRAVINTHWHDDHVFGNGVYRDSFPGVEFIAHTASAEDLVATGLASRAEFEANRGGTETFLRDLVVKGQSFAGGPLTEEERLSHTSAADLVRDYGQAPAGYDSPVAGRLVRDSLILKQGTRTVRVLFLGRGHSRGDLIVHLPAERIVAAGDLVMAPVQFVGTTSFPPDFARAVDRIVALAPRMIVPGHGPVLQGTAHAQLIARLLHAMTDQVRAAYDRGETLEQARKSVRLDSISREMTGDSQMNRILFSYYVLTPAVQRTYELIAGKEP
jgi:glyoxylase-like metal-dependent hydrolase (beta-lactamase superfamily II)